MNENEYDISQLSAFFIKKTIGNIDDLSYELANTIANIYYRFFRLSMPYLNKENTLKADSVEALKEELLSRLGEIESCSDEATNFPYSEIAKALADIEVTPRFINILRSIDKTAFPNQYKIVQEIVLDNLKYKIENAEERLLILRLLSRIRKHLNNEIEEIPNLIDRLDI
ncbi:hypothetical protein MCHI_001919 [Candidatus Magnetoovum chiemensis]|nr:hypothetical protein MCHI_001919 [Candidatus Magnetoovum chiemensis]